MAEMTQHQVRAIAESFLRDQSDKVAPLEFRGERSYGDTEGRGKKCLVFEGPQEEELSIAVDSSSGVVFRFNWRARKKDSQRVVLHIDEAKLRALNYLTRKFDSLANIKLILKEKKLLDQDELGKVYVFRWEREVDGVIQPFGLRVEVAADSVAIVDLFLGDRNISISTKPVIPKNEATEIAIKGAALTQVRVLNVMLAVGGTVQQQRLEWRVSLEGLKSSEYTPLRGQVATKVEGETAVDALTGRVVFSLYNRVPDTEETVVKPAVAQPKNYTVADSFPSWKSNAELFFRTRRSIKNQSGQRSSSELLCLANETIRGVILAPRFMASPSADRLSKVAFAISDTVYVIDVQKGDMGRCNDATRVRRGQPSWDSTGTYLAMWGTHSPSDGGGSDTDIFMAKVESYLGPVAVSEQWCVAHLPGPDNNPVISPDGQWVAFAHLEKDSPTRDTFTPVWAIYLAKTARPQRGEKPQPPRKIIENVMLPERLSWFPDGKRLLIAYTGNEGTKDEGILALKCWPDILNVETKTLTPLNLPPLYDPDLPQGKGIPLVVREPQVSPDGKRIAFRALRWTGDAKDEGAICIYTCNLDGSDLKRITPPEGVPLEPYQYPQPGITAHNAWEKLEPKRNLGKPWSPEIQMQERQKELEERAKKKNDAPALETH